VWIVCDEAGAGFGGIAGGWLPSILMWFARAKLPIGSATIASPVPTVTSNSLRRIVDPLWEFWCLVLLIEHPACHRRIVEQVCVLVEARSIGSKGEGGKKP
jgi:hypothetical protein